MTCTEIERMWDRTGWNRIGFLLRSRCEEWTAFSEDALRHALRYTMQKFEQGKFPHRDIERCCDFIEVVAQNYKPPRAAACEEAWEEPQQTTLRVFSDFFKPRHIPG